MTQAKRLSREEWKSRMAGRQGCCPHCNKPVDKHFFMEEAKKRPPEFLSGKSRRERVDGGTTPTQAGAPKANRVRPEGYKALD